jgi:hypothetical protein
MECNESRPRGESGPDTSAQAVWTSAGAPARRVGRGQATGSGVGWPTRPAPFIRPRHGVRSFIRPDVGVLASAQTWGRGERHGAWIGIRE